LLNHNYLSYWSTLNAFLQDSGKLFANVNLALAFHTTHYGSIIGNSSDKKLIHLPSMLQNHDADADLLLTHRLYWQQTRKSFSLWRPLKSCV